VPQRRIDTKYGLLKVDIHSLAEGYVATVSGRHRLSANPVLDGPLAKTEDEAVAQLARAIERT
jgi:hypothetical protein